MGKENISKDKASTVDTETTNGIIKRMRKSFKIKNGKKGNFKKTESFIPVNTDEIEKHKIEESYDQKINIFHRQPPKKGFIDIWWLYDDGGKKILN